MVSPDALSLCCNNATAIIYENIRTHDRSTVYKEELVAEDDCSEKWDEALVQAFNGAVDYEDLVDCFHKGTAIKGSSYSTKKLGRHYIYVLTNTVC